MTYEHFAVIFTNILILLAVINCARILSRLEQAIKDKRTAENDRFCSYCGNSLPNTVSYALALPNKGYLAYTCAKCKKETLQVNPEQFK